MRGSIMWFRRDLRLTDNAALAAAIAHGPATLCVMRDPEPTPHGPGAAARQWRTASIAALSADVERRGGWLRILSGDVSEALPAIARVAEVDSVLCQRDWTPEALDEERRVREALAHIGVRLKVAEGQLLVAPGELLTAAGGPYRVFTPFYRAWRARIGLQAPLAAPGRLERHAPASDASAVATLPRESADLDLVRWWDVGEVGAQHDLDDFCRGPLADYEVGHDLPGIDGTSRLSPRLAHGEITPRQVAYAALDEPSAGSEAFVRQLAWREFAYHVLHHFPQSAERSLRPEFERFSWITDTALEAAWQQGKTGYPFVDAGMRQLAQTGWMHNRARMAAGSFLCKDLLVAWQSGEAWFRDRLVDYDAALNPFNWQWIAGSGADAAPFFRIFNPLRQSERFDANGDFARTWLPELGSDSYPRPIIDHAEARERALAAYSAIRS